MPFWIDNHFPSETRFCPLRLFRYELKVMVRETLLLFRQWP